MLTFLYFLGEPKIDQLEMTVGVNQDILWFHIAVGDALMVVEVLQNQDDLGRVKACGRLIKATSSAQVGEQFSTRTVVKLCERQHSKAECVAGSEQAYTSILCPRSLRSWW